MSHLPFHYKQKVNFRFSLTKTLKQVTIGRWASPTQSVYHAVRLSAPLGHASIYLLQTSPMPSSSTNLTQDHRFRLSTWLRFYSFSGFSKAKLVFYLLVLQQCNRTTLCCSWVAFYSLNWFWRCHQLLMPPLHHYFIIEKYGLFQLPMPYLE